MDTTKIENSFQSDASEAKKNFQAVISALLELHSDSLNKHSRAEGNKKTGVWTPLPEDKINNDHLLYCMNTLMACYNEVDQTNRLLNIQCIALQGMVEALEQENQDLIHMDITDLIKIKAS